MAPLPVLAGVYHTIVRATAGGRPITNIFHYQRSGVTLGDTNDGIYANAVALAVATRWGEQVGGIFSTDYTGSEVQVYPQGSPLLPASISTWTDTGGRAFDTAYKQVAALVHSSVSRRGKGSQSRSFLSPISNRDMTANGEQLTDAFRISTEAAFNQFVTRSLSDLVTATGGSWFFVQMSKKLGRTFFMTDHAVDTFVSSQDRRLQR
jgi:hypothetical protein